MCAALLLSLVGCAPERDLLAPFRGAFCAEVEGTLDSVSFSARIEAEAAEPGGARAVTVTFYAPETLCGTVVAQDRDGRQTISYKELCLELPVTDEGGYGALLSLFPTEGAPSSVTLTDSGNSKVAGDGYELEFLADGTPILVAGGSVRATVISFREGSPCG